MPEKPSKSRKDTCMAIMLTVQDKIMPVWNKIVLAGSA